MWLWIGLGVFYFILLVTLGITSLSKVIGSCSSLGSRFRCSG